jgi:cellulose synthase/poly-beta-1,6-N-acetylglucosamine synthase-like glycosyltransferase
MSDDTHTQNAQPERPSMPLPVLPSEDDLTIGQYAQAMEEVSQNMVSVIVPCANDHKWLPGCLDRVEEALRGTEFSYEILVVDDRSRDGTAAYVRSQEGSRPVRFVEKKGQKGRAISIKEGLDAATGGLVVLLDPDLRCPPGAFVEMLRMLKQNDVVVANREVYPFFAYAVFSRAYRWLVGRLLLTVEADVRSGLKMFKRSLMSAMRFAPEFDPRLGFDAFLLYHAKRAGWVVNVVSVAYTRPMFHHGVRGAITSRASLVAGALTLRFYHLSRWMFPFLYPPQPQEYFEAGFTNINDYLFLAPEQSAKGHLTREVYLLIFYTLLIIAAWFALIELATGKSFAWSFFFHIAIIQFILIAFKFYVVWITFQLPPQPPRMLTPDEMGGLPMISVILPVYKEKEIIPQLCARMSEMHYPPDKLDMIFIFEEGDDETIQAFLDHEKPAHFKGLVSPDVKPKTKPKALNVALRETKGDLLVIFDAETLPDPDQFLKVVSAFRNDPTLDYIHCRIDVYNSDMNAITKLYAAEFAFFYNFFLPGLATVHSPTPISGHSVYFRREQLIKVGGWDAYNLAEDCDIGIRMFRKGYKNATVLDSYSWEQSTTNVRDWLKQRTRWMQGFVQTSMVNLRYPALLWKDLGGLRNMLMFMFHVPGGVFLNGINLVQWCMLGFWYFTRDPQIQTIFTDVLLYLSVTSFFVANVAFTYFNLVGLFWRRYFSIVPYALFSFLYWLLLSYATLRAILRFFRQESTWDKTYHPSSSVTVPDAARLS